ncbi:MAG: flagellar basal body P-ring formation chaperone FlgA [Bacteroidetes bacterium]|nr:flagellar basal body P-ring formation chaperone FlgA [Bacteroidota bacterium]MBU1115122.1 flagellar basal body P-ring formation chaperone FlgA [Bacteroidota bacterium]MBU1799261.1 flagellar basal body P-ring formation chaperone FlgA [Bacteroidota bacterium]
MLMFFFYILSVITSFESLPIEIKDKLQSEFSSHKKVEFEIVNAPKEYKDIFIKKGEDINVIGSIAYVPVSVIDKRGSEKRTTISVKVKIYEDVFVSMKDVDKREQLLTNNFQLVEKEITSIRGEIVSSLGEIVGSRASRFISKGDILTRESMENLPAIYNGDKISAASIIGNVKVSFSAIAKQEGCVGDIIRIRTNTNEIFKAEIIDYKNVLIVE